MTAPDDGEPTAAAGGQSSGETYMNVHELYGDTAGSGPDDAA